MTTDHIQLAARIIRYIAKEGTVSYEAIEERAATHGIPSGILDNAMVLVHRNKGVSAVKAGGTIMYAVAAPKKAVTPVSHTTWLTENYPWPGKAQVPDFVMPFPEIDMSWIVLKGEELDKYKAEARGRVYISKKKYEHH